VLSELEEVADDAVFLVAGETVDADRVAAAAERARTWRIRLADLDPREGVVPVAQVLGLDAALIPVDRRDLLVSFPGDAAAAAGLAALIGAGLPVAEFAAATGTLEHTFLDLGDEGSDR
ncbi:MAG: ABC transporter ATP-binding protein, partial [Microbacterium sp.]